MALRTWAVKADVGDGAGFVKVATYTSRLEAIARMDALARHSAARVVIVEQRTAGEPNLRHRLAAWWKATFGARFTRDCGLCSGAGRVEGFYDPEGTQHAAHACGLCNGTGKVRAWI